MMKRHLVTAFLYTAVTAVLLGIVYPLVITGIAHLAFPAQASGQLHTARWCAHWIATDRPAIYWRGIFSLAPLGSGRRIRCRCIFRLQSRSNQ